MGIRMGIRVKEDSPAAKGVASRTGLGKVRHIEVNQLWVQEKIAQGKFEVGKVGTDDNRADILTKDLEREKLDYHLSKLFHIPIMSVYIVKFFLEYSLYTSSIFQASERLLI